LTNQRLLARRDVSAFDPNDGTGNRVIEPKR